MNGTPTLRQVAGSVLRSLLDWHRYRPTVAPLPGMTAAELAAEIDRVESATVTYGPESGHRDLAA